MAATSAKFRVTQKRARLFAIASDHSDQQGSLRPTVPTLDLAAPERVLSNSSETRRRSRWPPLQSLISRGSQGSVYPTVLIPDRAALARSLSYLTETRLRPPWTYLQHLAPRGGLRAHLRH
ncbi:hypothetical protein EDB86DRAFT_3083935 [Lactarius hatsudake]|nr:hypothetical protein EDB86DRAFT_3083935 [Lactarius hatsudake]